MTKLRFISKSLDTIGTLMLSFVLFSVHDKFKTEKSIDAEVIAEMENEQIVVIIALFIFALSWVLSVIEEFEASHKHNILLQHDKNYKKINRLIYKQNSPFMFNYTV